MDRYEQRLYKFKRQNSMLMSNPKWVKFFTVMTQFPDISCVVKFFMTLPPSTVRHFPPSYHIHETGIGDCSFSGGPCRYEEIEWILIPLSFKCGEKIIQYNCDAKNVLAKLSAKGSFPVEHIISSNSPCIINGVLLQEDSVVPYHLRGSTLVEYLVIKGYTPLTPPLPPQSRRGPRAKKKS